MQAMITGVRARRTKWHVAVPTLIAAIALSLGITLWSWAAGAINPSPTDGSKAMDPGGAAIGATWAFRPASLRELADSSSIAVFAQVTDVQSGPPLEDLSGEDLGEPDEQGPPTQRIAFDVDEQLFGSAPTDLVVFKTGSDEAWIDGDPPYSIGQSYLLFLDQANFEPAAWVPPAPDGRLVLENGELRPMIAGPPGTALSGLTQGEAADLIRGLAN